MFKSPITIVKEGFDGVTDFPDHINRFALGVEGQVARTGTLGEVKLVNLLEFVLGQAVGDEPVMTQVADDQVLVGGQSDIMWVASLTKLLSVNQGQLTMVGG